MNPGDKVVCVDGKFPKSIAALYTALPKEGATYVIRDVRLGIQLDCRTGDVSLTLVGLNNPSANSRAALERGFSASRFRPLEDIKAVVRVSEQVRDLIPA